MKALNTLLTVTFSVLYYTGLLAQWKAYNPENSEYSLFTGNVTLDEMGEGTVDSAFIKIEVDGMMAHVEMSLRLVVYPYEDRKDEDNDSIELRTHFAVDDAWIFNHIQMRMHDSIREGRVISKDNALNIWVNNVYNPDTISIPRDPGLLLKNGQLYELRAYPVGVQDYALVNLHSTVLLDSLASDFRHFRLPMSILRSSNYPIHQLSISINPGNFYDLITTNAGTFHALNDSIHELVLTDVIGPQDFDFQLHSRDNIPHPVHHYEDGTSMYSVATFPGNDDPTLAPNTNYLVLVDVDFEETYFSDEIYFKSMVARHISNLMTAMLPGDSFRLIVNKQFMASMSEGMLPVSDENISSALEFISEHAYTYSDAIASLTYAKLNAPEIGSQLLLYTSDRMPHQAFSKEELQALATQLDLNIRTDVFSIGYNSNTAFYSSITTQTGGVFRRGWNLDHSPEVIRPYLNKISSIHWDENTEAYIHYNPQQKVSTLSLLNGTWPSNKVVSIEFSNHTSRNFILPNTIDVVGNADVKCHFGKSKLLHLKAQATSITKRTKEKIGINHGILVDETALLVVEHDSLYNDTTLPIVFMPFPLGQASPEITEISRDLIAYPNPTTNTVTLRSSNGIKLIAYAIYSFDGRLVTQKKFSPAGHVDINLREQAPGTYYIHCTDTESTLQILCVIKE